MNQQTQILTFEVVRQGGIVYMIWPWRSLTQFLVDAAQLWGVHYEVVHPESTGRRKWIELRVANPEEVAGEYRRDLFYSFTPLGLAMNRNQAGWYTHYLTQHGLDGLPKTLWDTAYELETGQPVGCVRFIFKIHSDCGLFQLSFYEWQHYFISGRNSQKLSDLAIQIKSNKGG